MANHSGNQWRSGEWWALCDFCGLPYHASELTKDWQGFMACRKDLTARNPQDFVRPRIEDVSVPWTRPDDTQGDITAVTSNQTPSASLTETILHMDTTSGALTVTLPAANDSSFLGVSIRFQIWITSGTNNVTVSSASAIVGSTTIIPNVPGFYRNVPASNTWIRE